MTAALLLAGVVAVAAVLLVAVPFLREPAPREDSLREPLEAERRALALAEGASYVRLFVDEGAPMGALLAQVAERESPLAGYAATLLSHFGFSISDFGLDGASPIVNPKSPIQNLVEPLSERELEVLRLIADGHSNQAIADRLVVAVSTVKKHVNNIYGKLDVQSRTQALARAHDLNLL